MSRAVGVLDPLTPYTSPGKRRLGEGRPYHTQVHVPFGGMRWVVNVFKAPPFPKDGWWGDDGYEPPVFGCPPIDRSVSGDKGGVQGESA